LRQLQRAADRLLTLFVPKVSASAFWYTECSCLPPFHGCGIDTEKVCRRCHDASGYCTPWTHDSCGC
jgi:hypothetical protein